MSTENLDALDAIRRTAGIPNATLDSYLIGALSRLVPAQQWDQALGIATAAALHEMQRRVKQ